MSVTDTETTETVEAVTPAKTARPRPSRANATPAKPAPPRTQSARAKSPQSMASVMDALGGPPPAPGEDVQHIAFVGGENPQADVAMKMRHVFEDGVWVEKLVPSHKPDAIELITDPRAILIGDISLQWEALGRKNMAWAWVHSDPKYSNRERSMGYGRVDPAKVHLAGYQVRDVPGTGRCYVLQDVILMEIPTEIRDYYRKLGEDEILSEQQERKGIAAKQDAETNDRYKGLVTVSRGVEEDWESFSNPIAQEQQALARSMKAAGGSANDLRF